MKKYSFFFHYNKPLSKQRGKPQVSVHYRNQCAIVDNVVLNGVNIRGRIRKRQPYYVLCGKADITIKDKIAYFL